MPRSRVQRPWIGQLPRRRHRGPRGWSAGFRRHQRSGVTGLPTAPGLGSRRISGGRGCRDHRTHRRNPGRASSPSPGTGRRGGGAVLPTAGPELPASALSRRPHGSRGGRPATSGTRSYTSAQPHLSRPGPGSASEGAPRGRVAPWPLCGHSAMSPHRCCVRSPVAPAPAVPVTRVRAQTLRTGITPPMSADRAPGPQAPARPDCRLCHRVLEQVVRQPLSPGQPVARPRPSPGSL